MTIIKRKKTFLAKETSFENEIRFLEKECAILLAEIEILQKNMEKVDQYDKNQLYEINEKIIHLLSLVNAYLIRFNKFMNDLNKKN